jgi:hypothetical protein
MCLFGVFSKQTRRELQEAQLTIFTLLREHQQGQLHLQDLLQTQQLLLSSFRPGARREMVESLCNFVKIQAVEGFGWE